MKRSRGDDVNDVDVGSQSKKAGGSSSSETAAFAYLMSVKLEVSSSLYAKFLLLLQDFRTSRIDVGSVRHQVKKLFSGYRDLILGFNLFLPESYKISLDDEDDEETDTELEIEEEDCDEDEKLDSGKFEQQVLRFVNKVKLRFRKGDQHVDTAFLDLLRASSLQKKVISFDDYSKAAHLLGDHPDLLQDFDRLIGPAWNASDGSDHQTVTIDDDPDREVKTKLLKQGLKLCNKVEQVLSDSDYHEFLRKLYDYSSGKITRDDLKVAITSILGSDRNLVEDFTSFINAPAEHLSKLWRFEEEKKEQKHVKSVYELDLAKCKRIGPSYWLLPKDYHDSSSTQTLKKDEVLNDKFVCLSGRGENYPFKHRQIQQREEILFRCEDDRYEMDMLMEHITSAIEKVRKLSNDIEEKKVNLETGIKIENHLSILNRRCIERLYGEYGLEMMDVMQEQPIKALPLILKRLEQKQQELTKFKTDFNKFFADIYAKNLLKKPAVKQQKSSRECSVEECDHVIQQTVKEQASALQGADSSLQALEAAAGE